MNFYLRCVREVRVWGENGRVGEEIVWKRKKLCEGERDIN